MFSEFSKRAFAEIPKELRGGLGIGGCQRIRSVVPFGVFNDTERIGCNVMNSRGAEKHHTLAFGFRSPLGEGVRMPIDNREVFRCCGHITEQPDCDRHTVYPATDDGNRNVPMC